MEQKTILAIETSGKVCSVALATFNTFSDVFNFAPIAEYSINVGNKHDKFCAELCNRILEDNNYKISNIDVVAVSIGPGSFTGLRIGVAIAKGICFTADELSDNQIPLIAVPTLTALADNTLSIANLYNKNINISDENIAILSIIPSHNNLVYHQTFSKTGEPLSNIELIDLDLLFQKYSLDTDIIIATNSPMNIKFGIYVPQLSSISASSIAKLGAKMYSNNERTNSIDIQPLYIQDFQIKTF